MKRMSYVGIIMGCALALSACGGQQIEANGNRQANAAAGAVTQTLAHSVKEHVSKIPKEGMSAESDDEETEETTDETLTEESLEETSTEESSAEVLETEPESEYPLIKDLSKHGRDGYRYEFSDGLNLQLYACLEKAEKVDFTHLRAENIADSKVTDAYSHLHKDMLGYKKNCSIEGCKEPDTIVTMKELKTRVVDNNEEMSFANLCNQLDYYCLFDIQGNQFDGVPDRFGLLSGLVELNSGFISGYENIENNTGCHPIDLFTDKMNKSKDYAFYMYLMFYEREKYDSMRYMEIYSLVDKDNMDSYYDDYWYPGYLYGEDPVYHFLDSFEVKQ